MHVVIVDFDDLVGLAEVGPVVEEGHHHDQQHYREVPDLQALDVREERPQLRVQVVTPGLAQAAPARELASRLRPVALTLELVGQG